MAHYAFICATQKKAPASCALVLHFSILLKHHNTQIHLILWCARETFFQALIDMFFSFHFFLLCSLLCFVGFAQVQCTSFLAVGTRETCCLKRISNIDPWLLSPNKSFWEWCWSHKNYYHKLKNNAACFEITSVLDVPTASLAMILAEIGSFSRTYFRAATGQNIDGESI